MSGGAYLSRQPYSTATLSSVMALQEDLESLCRERPLRTREFFRLNSYYGMDRILKHYAGLGADYQLKLALPHGPELSRNGVRPTFANAQVPAIWCYPRYLEGPYAQVTNKQIIPGACPYLYLLRMLPSEKPPPRSGTIFFPAHSTRHLNAETDLRGIAARLRALPDAFRPITVCMYWRDLMQGRQQPFEEAGLRIVSAGHVYDPEFLVRLHYLCSVHRYAASNVLGSHIFYSVKSGCSFFLLDGDPVAYMGTAKHFADQAVAVPERTEQLMRRLFAKAMPGPSRRQLMVTDYMLGANHILTPAELRATLLRLERADKCGYIRHRPGKMPAVVLSPRLRRSYANAGRLLRRLQRAVLSLLAVARFRGSGGES